MIKKLLIIIFVYSTLTSNLYPIEPDVFVQSTVNRASKLLSENITKEEKIEKPKRSRKPATTEKPKPKQTTKTSIRGRISKLAKED